jgi:hypothetical protein
MQGSDMGYVPQRCTDLKFASVSIPLMKGDMSFTTHNLMVLGLPSSTFKSHDSICHGIRDLPTALIVLPVFLGIESATQHKFSGSSLTDLTQWNDMSMCGEPLTC